MNEFTAQLPNSTEVKLSIMDVILPRDITRMSTSPLSSLCSAKHASVWADNLCRSFVRLFVCAAVTWTRLPDSLKDTALPLSCFQYHLNTFVFSEHVRSRWASLLP